MKDETGRAAERVARDSFGRLVAFLAARTRDVAAAEDALSEAFAAALRQWPGTGVPESPAAWLLSVARRRGADAARHRAVEADDRLAGYQPSWATRGALLARAGRLGEARAALTRALGLADDPAVGAWLRTRIEGL